MLPSAVMLPAVMWIFPALRPPIPVPSPPSVLIASTASVAPGVTMVTVPPVPFAWPLVFNVVKLVAVVPLLVISMQPTDPAAAVPDDAPVRTFSPPVPARIMAPVLLSSLVTLILPASPPAASPVPPAPPLAVMPPAPVLLMPPELARTVILPPLPPTKLAPLP